MVMDDIAHRQFDQLAALGARNVGHDKNRRRHIARCGVFADGAVAEIFVASLIDT
jgi:hypothetical protein